jgi:hypothetical protein
MLFRNKEKKQAKADMNLLFYIGTGIVIGVVVVLATTL